MPDCATDGLDGCVLDVNLMRYMRGVVESTKGKRKDILPCLRFRLAMYGEWSGKRTEGAAKVIENDPGAWISSMIESHGDRLLAGNEWSCKGFNFVMLRKSLAVRAGSGKVGRSSRVGTWQISSKHRHFYASHEIWILNQLDTVSHSF